MAKIDSALASGAYSTFTTALEFANTADAMANDIVKLENEKHYREVKTSHDEMKKTGDLTNGLTF